jgi:hypothetical protein
VNIDEVIRRTVRRVKRMSNREVIKDLKRLGIVTKGNRLSRRYGGR